MELYFEKIYGDLTRIGHFSEHHFGWNIPQPGVELENLKDYPLTEADILVIGDSFSVSRIWQSKLIADGFKVSSLKWQDMKPDDALRTDLGEAIRATGFKGRYLIIESVERVFQNRMKVLYKVNMPIAKQEVINTAFPLYPMTKRERVSFSQLNGLGWSIKTLYNTLILSLNLPEKYLKSDKVQASMFDGCQLFSHRLCRYQIFFDGDFKKETFTAIDNVLSVNKNLQNVGIQPIWMIVPDKATVYLGYGVLNKYPYQNIWQKLAEYPELIAPDLGTAFIKKSRIIKDFYMPNDTHMSNEGFLYLGDIMTNGLHNMQANKAKPFSE